MLCREFKTMVDNGLKPVIEFTAKAQEHDLDPDEGMRCEVISCTEVDRDGVFSIICNLLGWESYNKDFARPLWRDNNRNWTLNWFESGYYPKDNRYEIFLDADFELDVFKIVKISKYYEQYKESKSLLNYITWLETKLDDAEDRIFQLSI